VKYEFKLQKEQDLVDHVDELRKLICYDPLTGVFVWSKKVGRHSEGKAAGWVHSRGYLCITINRCKVYAHRLAFILMKGCRPEADIDHINGIRTDNRWVNLRSVDRRTNLENRTSLHNESSASGLLGVHWCNQKQAWHAEIKTHSKKRHIGFFQDKNKAQEAYLQVKREIHSGFTL